MKLLLFLSLVAVTALAGTQEGTNIQPVEVKRVATAMARLVPGDEIDQLESELKPKARFTEYKPQWRVEKRDFVFAHYNRQETKTWTVVLDGDKPVAVMRSGDFMLVALTPDTAKTKLAMPTERLHLDNLLGPSLPTHPFISKVKTHGSIYETGGELGVLREGWEASDRHLVFIRKLVLDEYAVEARFIFTVDPVYGYRIDAPRELLFNAAPAKDKVKLPAGTFTPGCYPPWKKDIIYNRTVYTPVAGGLKGWANNLVTMDRSNGTPGFSWRDGGFIAYLPGADGWSPCFTRQDGAGGTRKLNICNAHNDFHITLLVPELKTDASGKYPYRYVHRLLALPPEMSSNIWHRIDLIQQNAKSLIIKVGEVEDFEQQPVALTEPARGLVWTSGEPKLVQGDAHSGKQSIQIAGNAWPNLPQVSLQPNTKYRLEGWLKIVETKPDTKPRAFIKGDYYEWSPHTGPMVEKQQTTEATTVGKWEKVVLDFTAPAWGPFINITFVAENCVALLDDFALRVFE